MRTAFNHYEKQALYAFGSNDRIETVNALEAMANLCKKEAEKAAIKKLMDKVQNGFYFYGDYLGAYREAQKQIKAEIDADLEFYQAKTGNKGNTLPWKAYAMSAIVDAFCDEYLDDCITDIMVMGAFVTDNDVERLLEEVDESLRHIRDFEPDSYEAWLDYNRGFVKSVNVKKKKGKQKYKEAMMGIQGKNVT